MKFVTNRSYRFKILVNYLKCLLYKNYLTIVYIDVNEKPDQHEYY